MQRTDLKGFYSGGYFLLRTGTPDKRPPTKEAWPTDYLVSLSECVSGPRLSVVWGWEPGSPQTAREFGIPEARMNDFIDWCRSGYKDQLDLFSMFYSPDAARAFVKTFELPTDELHLIGIGLPKEIQPGWLIKAKNASQFGTVESFGIVRQIEKAEPLDESGAALGYDIVSFDHDDFSHSWLCSYLERDMYDLFGIHANQIGLLDGFADASTVRDWIAEDEEQGFRAEPEPYEMWLLVSYPL